jgi:hypothetical protein
LIIMIDGEKNEEEGDADNNQVEEKDELQQLTRHHTMQLPSVEADTHWLPSLLIVSALTGPLCSDIEDTSA